MHPRECNDLFLKSLTERLTKEYNKEVILLGDFNTDLIKLNSKANASEFLDIICCSNLLPHITSPTRLTSKSHTLCKQDVDLSYKKFLDKITKLRDIHAPVKKLSHKEKKSLSKPWLTKGILQSIKQKNVLYRKFIRTKDLTKRELLLQNFKIYKNTIHELIRINKSDLSAILKNTKNNSKKPGMGLALLAALRVIPLQRERLRF